MPKGLDYAAEGPLDLEGLLAGHERGDLVRAVRKGQRVTVWTASANRDERVFDEPFRFDVTRSPNRHLGFAYGEHFCLGVHIRPGCEAARDGS